MSKKKTRAVIDGEVCLNYEGLAKVLNYAPEDIILLSRRGMPRIHFPNGQNLYPVKRCRAWCKKNGKLMLDVPHQTKQTLCWKCDRAAGDNRCSWAFDGTPVEGWVAKETFLVGSDGKSCSVRSFCVYECPEFEPDKPRKVRPY